LDFVAKWGSPGSGNGQFNVPSGLAVGANGDVYVTDRNNHRVQVFTNDGVFISAWGDSGAANGQFASPRDVAIDPNGEVYVVDHLNDRIQVFTSTGTYLRQWGVTGTGNGQFKGPRGIAIDDSFHVFVSEDGLPNKRIQKFTSTGTYLAQWGTLGSGDGQFLSPRGVSADGAGNVFVMDALNNRLQKFTSTGSFLMLWGTGGSSTGEFDFPVGVACASGRVLVADQNNHRLQTFSPTGVFQESLGSHCQMSGGTGCVDPDGAGPLELGDGQFNLPFAVASDSQGNVFVADSQNHRIQKFGRHRTSGTGPGGAALTGLIVAPNPARAAVTVQFGVGRADLADGGGTRVVARVIDGSGRLVRRLFQGSLPPGDHTLVWDGTGRSGTAVPPGVYFVDLSVDGSPSRSVKLVRLP
jgi:DNA-binding beta-propeller fold protein YncE